MEAPSHQPLMGVALRRSCPPNLTSTRGQGWGAGPGYSLDGWQRGGSKLRGRVECSGAHGGVRGQPTPLKPGSGLAGFLAGRDWRLGLPASVSLPVKPATAQGCGACSSGTCALVLFQSPDVAGTALCSCLAGCVYMGGGGGQGPHVHAGLRLTGNGRCCGRRGGSCAVWGP